MAFLTTWFQTSLPPEIIDILDRDLINFDPLLTESLLNENLIKDHQIRHSQHSWIPTNHWIGGFLWHYIQRANKENFLYDLSGIDGEYLQYTKYEEGHHYNWHTDSSLSIHWKPQKVDSASMNKGEELLNQQGEMIRKLSFSLQLSSPDEYTGGDLQFIDDGNKTFFAPKERGTLIFFDSRTKHRVRKIKSGVRKSLVGWVVGPRWK
jgi:PKHD-type hydroxylase